MSMSGKLEEQRYVIKFLLLESKKSLPQFQRLQKSFLKPDIPFNLFSWVSQFREDRTSAKAKPMPGRPAVAVTLQWRRMLRFFSAKIAEVHCIGKASTHQILHKKKISISKVSAR